MVRGKVVGAPHGDRETWKINATLNYDEQSDLALVAIEHIAPPEADPLLVTITIPFPLTPPSRSVKPGQTVYALGNPEGLTGTISQGIVSAALRQFKDGPRIQITALSHQVQAVGQS